MREVALAFDESRRRVLVLVWSVLLALPLAGFALVAGVRLFVPRHALAPDVSVVLIALAAATGTAAPLVARAAAKVVPAILSFVTRCDAMRALRTATLAAATVGLFAALLAAGVWLVTGAGVAALAVLAGPAACLQHRPSRERLHRIRRHLAVRTDRPAVTVPASEAPGAVPSGRSAA